MAHERSRRKRRLARLSTTALLALLTAVALAGCTGAPRIGWSLAGGSLAGSSRPDGGAALTELEGAWTTITVSVELPPGYEAADDFVQRATLRFPDGQQVDTQNGLDRAFRLQPPQAGGEAELELMLGFCESDVKEICYVDVTTLPLRLRADGAREPDADVATLVYRPEAPK